MSDDRPGAAGADESAGQEESRAGSNPDRSDGPTPPSERIVALDALRGFALLGILVINIRVFSMPERVLANPTIYGDFSGANYWAWFVGHVFAEGTFIALFTILFGGGVILFTRRADRGGREPFDLYFWRIGWLLAFGLAHAYLLWYGDILVAYALCGLFVVLLKDLTARVLATVGVLFLAVPSVIEALAGLFADPAIVASTWEPSTASIEAEFAAYRGSYVDQFSHRIPAAFGRQTSGFLGYTAWRVGGLMLLGMALFKWGVLTNERTTREYGRLIAVGGAGGIAVILAGVWYVESADWGVEAALFYRQFNYWGSIALAVAYVGLVMRFCRWRPTGMVSTGLAAVGRTAFSNYILQTVLATSIFYGHGLGLFGHVTRVEALGIVVVIWAIQIPLSVLWLHYFRYGPIEWLWRVLTYRERQPLRVERRG
ncbi:DUF418 domain-containing protein [Halovivax gelatinilyticus]|uniref:DUF418 domain-containing protein n=1 Tax=Halovivax gelatinilyticus TaxID=2961597 RepID=UPI0020CA6B0E|nr:DUF418 domain-containing protein [Halovivax gelatinilyticus]